MTKYDEHITDTSSMLQKNTISLYGFNFYNTIVQAGGLADYDLSNPTSSM